MLRVKAGDQFPSLTMGTISWRKQWASLHNLWGGVLRGVCGHVVVEAVFCNKVRNGHFLGRESLVGESRIQLAGLSDEAEARDKESLPMPFIYKRNQLLIEGIHTTHWAFVHNLLLRSSRLLE
jgi:hypothetical protein